MHILVIDDEPAVRQIVTAAVSKAGYSVDQAAGVIEAAARALDDAERCVPSSGQLGGGLDDLLQQRVERELRAERDARVDEEAEPVGLPRALLVGSGHLVAETTQRAPRQDAALPPDVGRLGRPAPITRSAITRIADRGSPSLGARVEPTDVRGRLRARRFRRVAASSIHVLSLLNGGLASDER